ncbi:hypothetical protein QTO34_012785 [Cnephaeus nilssonii]|uniref:Uncharacterized protein n=1 Tax=Cnephaeus nilssonii TaxID=3371016 RepID=A0AA40HC03_CNENI|nr:hypothetical protein QTO34_012785 [Eptesicus nilssonii]
MLRGRERSSSKKMYFIWPRASWALSVRLLPQSEPCRPQAHLAVPSVPGSISVWPSMQMVVVAFTFKVMFWEKWCFTGPEPPGSARLLPESEVRSSEATLLCPQSRARLR